MVVDVRAAFRGMHGPWNTNKNRMDLNRNFAVRCLQSLLVLVAVLLTVAGCCLVGIGIFIYLLERFERPLLGHLAIAASAIGAGSISIGILGCCAVFTKRNAIRITFVVSAATGLLAAMVVGCWLSLQMNTLLEDSTSCLQIAIDSYFSNESIRHFINNVQQRLLCCGAELGYADYGRHVGQDLTTVCEMQFYGEPCNQPLADYLSQKLTLVLGMTAASGFLLVVVLVQFLVMFCIGSPVNGGETI